MHPANEMRFKKQNPLSSKDETRFLTFWLKQKKQQPFYGRKGDFLFSQMSKCVLENLNPIPV